MILLLQFISITMDCPCCSKLIRNGWVEWHKRNDPKIKIKSPTTSVEIRFPTDVSIARALKELQEKEDAELARVLQDIENGDI